MAIKRITECFVTSDGKIHTNEADAERHETMYRDKNYFDRAIRTWQGRAENRHSYESLFNVLREQGMTFIVR